MKKRRSKFLLDCPFKNCILRIQIYNLYFLPDTCSNWPDGYRISGPAGCRILDFELICFKILKKKKNTCFILIVASKYVLVFIINNPGVLKVVSTVQPPAGYW